VTASCAIRTTLIFEGRRERPVNASDFCIGFQILVHALFHQLGEPRWECGLCSGCPQVPYAATSIGKSLTDQISCAVYLLTRLVNTRLSEQMGGELKLNGDADESLRQRVVNLPSNACALREDRGEL